MRRRHCGNRRLRVIASMFIERYAKAETKDTNSEIVSEIQETILKACPGDHRAAFFSV
jgi:hypothetical protein